MKTSLLQLYCITLKTYTQISHSSYIFFFILSSFESKNIKRIERPTIGRSNPTCKFNRRKCAKNTKFAIDGVMSAFWALRVDSSDVTRMLILRHFVLEWYQMLTRMIIIIIIVDSNNINIRTCAVSGLCSNVEFNKWLETNSDEMTPRYRIAANVHNWYCPECFLSANDFVIVYIFVWKIIFFDSEQQS